MFQIGVDKYKMGNAGQSLASLNLNGRTRDLITRDLVTCMWDDKSNLFFTLKPFIS